MKLEVLGRNVTFPFLPLPGHARNQEAEDQSLLTDMSHTKVGAVMLRRHESTKQKDVGLGLKSLKDIPYLCCLPLGNLFCLTCVYQQWY